MTTSHRRAPAFAKKFGLSNRERSESGAWIFLGAWSAANNLSRSGLCRVLCVPPGEDPLQFDWSILRGCHTVVWLYAPIDVDALAIVMRAAGALDLSFFDAVSRQFLRLALTAKSEQLLAEIKAESR